MKEHLARTSVYISVSAKDGHYHEVASLHIRPVARSGNGGVRKIINVDITSGRWPTWLPDAKSGGGGGGGGGGG